MYYNFLKHNRQHRQFFPSFPVPLCIIVPLAMIIQIEITGNKTGTVKINQDKGDEGIKTMLVLK